MFVRNLLLVVGVLCLLGGAALSVVWFTQTRSMSVEKAAIARPAVLVATHPIPAGTLLRPEDIGWKEVGTEEIRPGNLVRGQISESAFVGAITRRDFAANEELIASELVKPSERQFLSAVLKPGTRAVSISVEAPQNAAGLILPGDRVDVILTQTFEEPAADPTRKSVAETVMQNVQVIAVDQSLSKEAKPAVAAGGTFTPATASRIPKTVTFEVTEQQAERLFVAAQLGRLQLSVRPLEGRTIADAEDKRKRAPTWASDVSSALSELAPKQPQSSSTIERSVRRPPVISQ
jgi:pilus assembly protein CpaB